MINKKEMIKIIEHIEEIEKALGITLTKQQLGYLLLDYPMNDFMWSRGSGKTTAVIIKNLLKLKLPIKIEFVISKFNFTNSNFIDENGKIIDFSEGDIDCTTTTQKQFLNTKTKEVLRQISARSYLVHFIEK